VEEAALIDAGRADGVKSFEADELAQAHRTIAELEITRAAGAIFNGEDTVGPNLAPPAMPVAGASRPPLIRFSLAGRVDCHLVSTFVEVGQTTDPQGARRLASARLGASPRLKPSGRGPAAERSVAASPP
jgi:hypothetical protein